MKNESLRTNANRTNARRSTGPKTAEGKRKVSLNSLTHGFAGQTCVIPDHEKEAYAKHFQEFRAEYKPKGPTEQFLVQSLAELSWSTQQMRAMATNMLTMLGTGKPPRDTGDGVTNFQLAQAANLGEQLKQINLLGIYEQRKHRLFLSAQKELATLQAQRKANETKELAEAAQLRQTNPKTWQPAHDGFACSVEEIDRFISRNQRAKAAS
jgi:hypothetical protein